MIHFFPLFSRDAASTLYGEALRATGQPFRIFATRISFSYRSRWGLVFLCLPRLAAFAISSSITSLLRSTPSPDAVVISSDIEAIVFATVRRLAGRRQARIVLSPFIYTSRRGSRIEALRRAYYAWVLRHVDVAIVHSRLEVDGYRALFPRVATRFAYVPFGLNVDGREALIAEAATLAPRAPVLVAAGKSGRDYATLFQAVQGLNVELRVICDHLAAVPPPPPGARITVLGDCHGNAYLREIAGASIVIVPLAVSDISAGQMVIVQAKALARPLIITDTPTTRDYAANGHDALLVPLADAGAMRAAITTLLGDDALRARLASNAAASYAHDNGTHAFFTALLDAIG